VVERWEKLLTTRARCFFIIEKLNLLSYYSEGVKRLKSFFQSVMEVSMWGDVNQIVT